MRLLSTAVALVAMALLAGGGESLAARQLNTRRDPLGLALRVERLRIAHSTDVGLAGGSLRLQRVDPWLAYEMGRATFMREWREADGLFEVASSRPIAGTATSCAMCHNQPFRTPGAGGVIGEPASTGRNVPHLFGLGLLELIGEQVSASILAAHDRNGDGRLNVPDEIRGRRALVQASPGVFVDYGALEDLNGDGYPGLNDAIQTVTYGADGGVIRDGAGHPVRLDDERVAGYVPILAPFSSSVGDHHFSTIRLFANGAFQTILGLRVEDSTAINDSGADGDVRAGDGWASPSIAGARQPFLPVEAVATGACRGISEGELDMVEWFLLNQPRPASTATPSLARRGARLMASLGCTGCHVRTWRLDGRDDARHLPGDRRFFNLAAARDRRTGALHGTLEDLTVTRRLDDGTVLREPRRAAFTIEDVYTDLRHHDVGDRFYEYGYANGRVTLLRHFRTPPLWGVGLSAPYGHDGASATLDSVIRRHGGAAEAAARRYTRADPAARSTLVQYLESLVLFQPDDLPTDLNGDGVIAADFMRDGQTVGPERLRPELLFRRPPVYAGWTTDTTGARWFSYQLSNADQAYGAVMEGLTQPADARRCAPAHAVGAHGTDVERRRR